MFGKCEQPEHMVAMKVACGRCGTVVFAGAPHVCPGPSITLGPQSDRYEEGRLAGLREAAEIARAFPTVLYDKDGGRDATVDDIAEAIEAKAGEKQPCG